MYKKEYKLNFITQFSGPVVSRSRNNKKVIDFTSSLKQCARNCKAGSSTNNL